MLFPFQYAQNIIVALGDEHVFNTEGEWLAFKDKVLATLLEIMKKNWTGYGVIQCINDIRRPIYITPTRTQGDTCAEDKRTSPGWSGGIRVAIAPSFINGVQKGPGSSPDEILLHELIHAFSMISGSHQQGSLLMDTFDYHTIEEFIAIVLTNIYISTKKGNQSLRKDHRGFSSLEPYLRDNQHFLLVKDKGKIPYPHLVYIRGLTERGEKAKLCYQFVRHEDAPFNPVSHYLNNKQAFEQYFSRIEQDINNTDLERLLRESEELLRNQNS